MAYAALVISGGYVEAGDSGRHRLSSGDVIFHRPFESHLDRFEDGCAEVLNLPLSAAWVGPVLGRVSDPDALVRVAERDVRDAGRLLVASASPKASGNEDWPDLLAAVLLENPEVSLAAWAERHDLHSGSLSRGFRRQFGITAAEFRSNARTRKAIELLASQPLCEVAAGCGFADQAHMSRGIRRFTGLSPTQLRCHLRSQVDPTATAARG